MPISEGNADPGSISPWRSVGFMLSTLGYTVSRGFHEVLEPSGLEPRQFAVMRAVGLEEGQSQQALASRLQIPKSRMVAIVDELERRGILERRPNPDDRRVHALHLTDAGRELLGAAFQLALAHERRISGALSDEERARLLELLARVATALEIPHEAHAALRDGH